MMPLIGLYPAPGFGRFEVPCPGTAVVRSDFRLTAEAGFKGDGTTAIVSLFDVRLMRTENRGFSRTRNTGIEATSGETVAFTEGDTTPDSDSADSSDDAPSASSIQGMS